MAGQQQANNIIVPNLGDVFPNVYGGCVPQMYLHMQPFKVAVGKGSVLVHGYVSGGWKHAEDKQPRFLVDAPVAEDINAFDVIQAIKDIVHASIAEACYWNVGCPMDFAKSCTLRHVLERSDMSQIADKRKMHAIARVAGHVTTCAIEFWGAGGDNNDDMYPNERVCTWTVTIPCALLLCSKEDVIVAMQREIKDVHRTRSGDKKEFVHLFRLEVTHQCHDLDARDNVFRWITSEPLSFEVQEGGVVSDVARSARLVNRLHWQSYTTTYEWYPDELELLRC